MKIETRWISHSHFTADSLRDSLICANSSLVIPVVWCFICRFRAARIFHGILEATCGSQPPPSSASVDVDVLCCAGLNVLATRGPNSVLEGST